MIWTNERAGYVIPEDISDEPYIVDLEQGSNEALNIINAVVGCINIKQVSFKDGMFLYFLEKDLFNDDELEINIRASRFYGETLYGNVVIVARSLVT